MVRAARIEVECVQRIAPSKAPKHCLNARNFSNGIRLVSRAEVPVACCAGQSDVAAKICSFARTPCRRQNSKHFRSPTSVCVADHIHPFADRDLPSGKTRGLLLQSCTLSPWPRSSGLRCDPAKRLRRFIAASRPY